MKIKKLLCKMGFHTWEEVWEKWEGYYHFTVLRCKRCPQISVNVSLGLPPHIKKKAERIAKELGVKNEVQKAGH